MANRISQNGDGAVAVAINRGKDALHTGLGVRGEFMWIDKTELKVDHTYQRDQIYTGRVEDVAESFNWLACGCLLVIRRQDGTYWVYDGQHRKLSADMRADIKKLPCLVFDGEHVASEARAFLDVNTKRGAMKMYDKYRALLACGDHIASKVRDIASRHGVEITRNGGPNQCKCVAQLMRQFAVNRQVFELTFSVLAEICDDQPIPEDFVRGVFHLERIMKDTKQGSLLDSHNINAIRARTYEEFKKSISNARVRHGKGGNRICAIAIAECLNKGRRGRRIRVSRESDDE